MVKPLISLILICAFLLSDISYANSDILAILGGNPVTYTKMRQDMQRIHDEMFDEPLQGAYEAHKQDPERGIIKPVDRKIINDVLGSLGKIAAQNSPAASFIKNRLEALANIDPETDISPDRYKYLVSGINIVEHKSFARSHAGGMGINISMSEVRKIMQEKRVDEKKCIAGILLHQAVVGCVFGDESRAHELAGRVVDAVENKNFTFAAKLLSVESGTGRVSSFLRRIFLPRVDPFFGATVLGVLTLITTWAWPVFLYYNQPYYALGSMLIGLYSIWLMIKFMPYARGGIKESIVSSAAKKISYTNTGLTIDERDAIFNWIYESRREISAITEYFKILVPATANNVFQQINRILNKLVGLIPDEKLPPTLFTILDKGGREELTDEQLPMMIAGYDLAMLTINKIISDFEGAAIETITAGLHYRTKAIWDMTAHARFNIWDKRDLSNNAPEDGADTVQIMSSSTKRLKVGRGIESCLRKLYQDDESRVLSTLENIRKFIEFPFDPKNAILDEIDGLSDNDKLKTARSLLKDKEITAEAFSSDLTLEQLLLLEESPDTGSLSHILGRFLVQFADRNDFEELYRPLYQDEPDIFHHDEKRWKTVYLLLCAAEILEKGKEGGKKGSDKGVGIALPAASLLPTGDERTREDLKRLA